MENELKDTIKQSFDVDTMDMTDKRECAKSYRDITFSTLQFAERRNSELADEFTKLEVQIATILLAFGGLFLRFVSNDVNNLFPNYLLFIIKFIYVSSIFFLILSLALGLIHLMRKEKFWDEIMISRNGRLANWNKCIRKEVCFEEAFAFEKGATQGKDGIIRSPKWTWILQTVSLAIAVGLIFTLVLIFFFGI